MTDSVLRFLLDNLAGDAKVPLFCQYPGQIQPQPAYVELSEQGEVLATYSGELGGTLMRHAHGLDLTWAVSAFAQPQILAKLLTQGEGLALLERIHAGHSVHWDGSNNRGRLTTDAQAASEALGALLDAEFAGGDPDTCVQVWSAGDWLFTACTLADHWTTQSLDEAVATVESMADTEGVVLTGDVRSELLGAAERRFAEDGGDGLTAAHLAALVADGRITAEMANARNVD